MKGICIKEWVKCFNEGQFDSNSRSVQIDAGWYDWFCKDSSLAAKTKSLGKKLLSLIGSPKFDIEKTYVWFKNNCPMSGPLYDDFRIADMETGDTLYVVAFEKKGTHGCHEAHWEVWGRDNDFNGAIVSGSWTEVKKFFFEK